ncbi:MAG: NnrS family protein [Pseudomonadota bacterium]
MSRKQNNTPIGLLADPFRPFFLGAALFALFAIPFWAWIFAASPEGFAGFDAFSWHRHEMVFGYLAAVLAGFLFTAIPNWTGRLPLRGGGLGLLFLLWLAGRAMVAFWPLEVATAIVDCAFLVAIAGLAGREIVAGRNWRNAPICAVVSLLAFANILSWLPATHDIGWRLAMGLVALLIGLVGGRVTPSFTRNWLAKRDSPRLPVPFGLYDKLCLLLLLAAVTGWSFAPESSIAGALLVLAGAAHLVRLGRWRGWLTVAEPLLLVLHVGYLWLVVALILMGLTALRVGPLDASASLHALGAGAIGTMTVAVMSRAILGHTGRALVASPAMTLMFGAIVLSALVRVLAPILPMPYDAAITVAAFLWACAYGLFVACFAVMLMTDDRALSS